MPSELAINQVLEAFRPFDPQCGMNIRAVPKAEAARCCDWNIWMHLIGRDWQSVVSFASDLPMAFHHVAQQARERGWHGQPSPLLERIDPVLWSRLLAFIPGCRIILTRGAPYHDGIQAPRTWRVHIRPAEQAGGRSAFFEAITLGECLDRAVRRAEEFGWPPA